MKRHFNSVQPWVCTHPRLLFTGPKERTWRNQQRGFVHFITQALLGSGRPGQHEKLRCTYPRGNALERLHVHCAAGAMQMFHEYFLHNEGKDGLFACQRAVASALFVFRLTLECQVSLQCWIKPCAHYVNCTCNLLLESS